MYTPSKEELLAMGFVEESWEGKPYSYRFESLTFHVSSVCPWEHRNIPEEHYPYWVLGSWYHPWYPESREQVEAVILGFNK